MLVGQVPPRRSSIFRRLDHRKASELALSASVDKRCARFPMDGSKSGVMMVGSVVEADSTTWRILETMMQGWWTEAFVLLAGIALGCSSRFLFKFFEEYAIFIVNTMEKRRLADIAFKDAHARSAAARLDSARSTAAMNILQMMSRANLLVFRWSVSAYFLRKEIGSAQTIEDLGSDDLAKAATMLSEILTESGTQAVILGDKQFAEVQKWIGAMQAIVYDVEAAYETSRNLHTGEPPGSDHRVAAVRVLIDSNVEPQTAKAGQLYRAVRETLESHIGYRFDGGTGAMPSIDSLG